MEKKTGTARSLLFAMLVLMQAGSTVMVAQTDLESAKSVVKIKTSYVQKGTNERQLGTASGWCWKEPTLVVTALHAVAGIKDNDITIYKNPTQYCGATVVKVLKEADLALLRLKSDLGLTPLSVISANPNSRSEYFVWGFPQGVYTIQGDDIRFSRSLEAIPTLNSILTGDKLKDDLKTQGYPLPQARILRISSTIQPGHSGAPILTTDGKVIGIADGGLRGGTARINWAMPADYYVPKLYTSRDYAPDKVSMQTSLYSSSITVDANADEEVQNKELVKEVKENTISNGNQTVSKTWTASYETIFSTLPYPDQKETQDFLDTIFANTQTTIDLKDKQYDVYEDLSTGATFTIPSGEKLTIDNNNYYVSNADTTLQLWSSPMHFNLPFEDVKKLLDSNSQKMLKDLAYYKWSLAEPDKWKIDDENEKVSFQRTCTDGNLKFLYYHAEMHGSDLLEVRLSFDLSRNVDLDHIKQLVHYGVAALFATFPVH